MILNTGLNLIRSFLKGDSPTEPTHGAVGTGTTAVAAGDTTLDNEVGTRETVSAKTSDNGVVDLIFTLLSTQGNLGNLTEVGLFNASSSGTEFNRIVHAATSFPGTFNLKYVIRHTQTDV